MKERPILFNGAMVRAILDGSKTQTRRLIKPQPENPKGPNCDGVWSDTKDPVVRYFGCPFGAIGDRLWVRETWRVTDRDWDPDKIRVSWAASPEPETTDSEEYTKVWSDWINKEHLEWPDQFKRTIDRTSGMWRPSIHMPKWASRLTLEITEVRVQRLQDISEEDAKAEGVDSSEEKPMEYWEGYDKTVTDRYGNAPHRMIMRDGVAPPPEWMDEPRIRKGSRGANISAKTAFEQLWNRINGEDSWSKNPWVWAIAFRRIKP